MRGAIEPDLALEREASGTVIGDKLEREASGTVIGDKKRQVWEDFLR